MSVQPVCCVRWWSGDKAHCAGVCSAVGAHGWNINESDFFVWHGLCGCVLALVRHRVLSVSSLLGEGVGVCGVWKVSGMLAGVGCVWCTVGS